LHPNDRPGHQGRSTARRSRRSFRRRWPRRPSRRVVGGRQGGGCWWSWWLKGLDTGWRGTQLGFRRMRISRCFSISSPASALHSFIHSYQECTEFVECSDTITIIHTTPVHTRCTRSHHQHHPEHHQHSRWPPEPTSCTELSTFDKRADRVRLQLYGCSCTAAAVRLN
jgi:hypothetical protein